MISDSASANRGGTGGGTLHLGGGACLGDCNPSYEGALKSHWG